MSLSTTTRLCPTCGHPDHNRRDFCERCGEYLRWDATEPHEPARAPAPEPTVAVAPDPTVAVAPDPTVAVAPDPVLIVLREAAPVHVEAGGQATLAGLLRNQSGVVDNYDFRVGGVPAEWVVLPPTAYLLPFGSGDGHEQPFEVGFAPPRSPAAEGRAWPVAVEAVSRSSGRVAARARATLVVAPYEDVSVEPRPQRRRGRLGATFAIEVANRGNAEAGVPLRAADVDDACATRLDPPSVRVAPGGRATARLRVRPRRALWFGRAVEHRIDVEAPVPRQVAFRQLPWIPWWVPVALLAVVAVAIALLALRGERIVVPEVRGATVEQAQALLVEAGLTSAPRLQEQVVADPGQVGRVIAQTPAAGEEIGAGGAVILRAGVADQLVGVPDVRGATRDQAQALLESAGLTLGTLEPAGAPADAPVEFQNPAAGGTARLGSPVNVILAVEEEPEGEPEAPEPPAAPEAEAPQEQLRPPVEVVQP